MLVLAGDLGILELPGDRDGAAEMVGVCRPERRDRPAGLRPRRCLGRVGMHDATDVGEATVEREMGRRVG